MGSLQETGAEWGVGTPWGTGLNWLGVRRSCLGTTLAFPLVGPHRPCRLCLEAFAILASRRINQGVFKNPNVLLPFLEILIQLFCVKCRH